MLGVVRRIQASLGYYIDRLRHPPVPWPHLRVGAHTYGVHVFAHAGDPPNMVEVGAYSSIAPGAELMIGGNHRSDWASTYPFRIRCGLEGALKDGNPTSHGPILVGNDVWIGSGALILSGVTIGDGAIVAARAVVARDVRPYSIVAGNPAREVRRRFTDNTVSALLAIAWWTWPHEELLNIVPLLNGAPVEDLIAYGRARSQP